MKKILLILVFLCAGELSAQIKIPKPPKAPNYDSVFTKIFTVSPKEEKVFLESLPKELRKEVESIKKTDEKEYNRLIRDYRMKSLSWSVYNTKAGLFDISENRKKSEEISNLELESEVLGIKYQHVSIAEKARIKSALKATLNKLFELRESKRKAEVTDLEKRLSELKQKLKIRKENKDEIVKRRLQELIGENEYLKWD